MADRFVLDASAVAKLFLNEVHSDALRDWFFERRLAGDELLAPPLLPFEIGHTIHVGLGRSGAEGRDVLDAALRGIKLVGSALGDSFDLLDSCTFYDAAYVALAIRAKSPLVTYDERMRRLGRRLGVSAVSPGWEE